VARPYIEYILINFLVRLRTVTQKRCNPVEVHFTFGRPSSTREYDRVFGARVRFHQAINRLVFSRDLMQVQHPLADPELCEVLEDYVQRQLRRHVYSSPKLTEIQRAMAENLGTGNLTLAYLSRQFAKSCRSLQREIQSKGLTYRDLLDTVRRERAMTLLREEDLPIKELASRLSFGDPSSFCRAFRRWTGKSPAEYRGGHRQIGASGYRGIGASETAKTEGFTTDFH